MDEIRAREFTARVDEIATEEKIRCEGWKGFRAECFLEGILLKIGIRKTCWQAWTREL